MTTTEMMTDIYGRAIEWLTDTAHRSDWPTGISDDVWAEIEDMSTSDVFGHPEEVA